MVPDPRCILAPRRNRPRLEDVIPGKGAKDLFVRGDVLRKVPSAVALRLIRVGAFPQTYPEGIRNLSPISSLSFKSFSRIFTLW